MHYDHTSFTRDATPLETPSSISRWKKVGRIVDHITFSLLANNIMLLTAGLYAAWHVGHLAVTDYLEGRSGARAGWNIPAECRITGTDGRTRIWEFAPTRPASETPRDRNQVSAPSAVFAACDQWVRQHGYKTAHASIGLSINGVDGMYGDPDGFITGTAETYHATTTPAERLHEDLDYFRAQALANDMETRGTVLSFAHAQYRWDNTILPHLKSLVTIRRAPPAPAPDTP